MKRGEKLIKLHDKYIISYMNYNYYYLEDMLHTTIKGIRGLDRCIRKYNNKECYTNLVQVIEALDKKVKTSANRFNTRYGLYIVSKKVANKYVPGKIKIDMWNKPTWIPLKIHGTCYRWERVDSKHVGFILCTNEGDPAGYITQNDVYEIKESYHEMIYKLYISEYTAKQMLKRSIESSLMYKFIN